MRIFIALLIMLTTSVALSAEKKPSKKTKSSGAKASSSAAANAARAKELEEVGRFIDNLRVSTGAMKEQLPLMARPVAVAIQPRGKKAATQTLEAGAVIHGAMGVAVSITHRGIAVTVQNSGDSTGRVLWDSAVFVDGDKAAHKIALGDLPIADRNRPQPPATIPGGAKHSTMVYAADLVEWEDRDWKFTSHIDPSDMSTGVGNVLRVLVPIEVDGDVTEYTFKFEVDVSPENRARLLAAARREKVMGGLSVGMSQDEAGAALGAVAFQPESLQVNGLPGEEWTINSLDLVLLFSFEGKLTRASDRSGRLLLGEASSAR